MKLMLLVYSIALYLINPFWDPSLNASPLMRTFFNLREIEREFIWPLTQFFMATAMVFLVVNMTNSLGNGNLKKSHDSTYNTECVVQLLEDASTNYK
jgi:hypothetical protein